MSAGVDSSQLDELAQAAGQSTERLVCQIETSLSDQGITGAFTDPSSGILPVMPYVLGAGSALLGVGVFAGAFLLLRKAWASAHKPADKACAVDAEPAARPTEVPAPQAAGLDDTFSFIALGGGSSVPAEPSGQVAGEDAPAARAEHYEGQPWHAKPSHVASVPAGVASPCDASDDDDLELLALSYAAGCAAATPAAPHCDDDPDDGPGGGSSPHMAPASGASAREAYARTDLTIPMGCVSPSDRGELDFKDAARVLATGTGEVHRIDTPVSHLDFSGMDIVDEAAAVRGDEPLANPMVCHDDWEGVALSELREPAACEQADPQGSLSTGDYIALIATQAQPRPRSHEPEYVAPVIGPGVDPQAAARRQELIRASASPAATLLVDRDEAFLAQRACDNAREGASRADVSPAQAPRPSQAPSASGRPGPVAASTVFAGQRVGVDVQSRDVPAASSFMPPRPASAGVVVSDRGLSAAVAAASAAYAAFNSYPTVVNPVVPVNESARASQAAAYASAVYGSVEQPSQTYGRRPVPTSPDLRTSAPEGAAPCGAYIDHMVQDEFAHRHDSPAQRNAALGRMQVIDCSAVAPVSVRESVRRNRA